MHHLYTLLVMATIIASAPTYASGSCLSYGHSCWGAHGKRSGDLQPAQFIVPKANSLSDRQARLTEYLLSLSQLQQQKNPEDAVDDTGREEVILMEQPLRLYQILDQLPRSYEGKSSINN
ncbi:neuropeptide CCHamide-1 isoform X2 [Halyomorpha halys]|uniref:neuropeptide CCHamide-1 isoform X2 n=1 Tax=Halyomorpha halys TaxID=286706 RepID=UPI000D0C9078|nr:neuropeptide CCHamide-1 isoform X2 [Halyomorpha halys]